jgi:hypothetical protein
MRRYKLGRTLWVGTAPRPGRQTLIAIGAELAAPEPFAGGDCMMMLSDSAVDHGGINAPVL